MEEIHYSILVESAQAGKRLDQALASLFEQYSRSKLQSWIKDGSVLVDGNLMKAKEKVFAGQRIELHAVLQEQVACVPQDIPLNIVYQDEELLVINKPAGLVVHPAAGNPDGTLQNGLLYFDGKQIELPRAGIVHRLDKYTTGLMVVARTLRAHKKLVDALQARTVKREYRALVKGIPTAGGTVDEPIGRHPTQRVKMAVVMNGKHAVTHFKVLEKYRMHALLQVNLETGRTHQIRVHMAHLNFPLVGDSVYGGRLQLPPGADAETIAALQGFKRQALHAYQLGLEHPATGEPMLWQADMPQDMQQLCALLAKDKAHA